MKKTTFRILGAAVLASLAALALMAQGGSAPAGSKEALAVVEKLLGAMGGRRVLGSIKDTTISGTAEMVQYGITVPVTIYQKEPGKMRVDITIAEAGLTVIRSFDGLKGWVTNPQSGAIEEMPEAMAALLARQATGTAALLEPQKTGVLYALKPKAALEGKDYIVLEQTRADGNKTAYYLDPETYLPYKTETRALDMSGVEVEIETFPANYQKVGGTVIPFALRTLQNGAESQRLTITAVAYNKSLDDALFTLK